MSTHVLDTAQRYCDRFILLAHGQVKAHGTLKELQQKPLVPEKRWMTFICAWQGMRAMNSLLRNGGKPICCG